MERFRHFLSCVTATGRESCADLRALDLPLAPFAGEIALIASRASVAADCSAARRLAPGALTVMSSAGMEHSTSNIWLRSEEHTSELQSLMRISYAFFCLKNKAL